MVKVIYIGQDDCRYCKHYKETVIDPLAKLYPGNVEAHMSYDAKIAEVDARKLIDGVPLIVVERDGVEEVRLQGRLSLEDLEGIILREQGAPMLEEAFK